MLPSYWNLIPIDTFLLPSCMSLNCFVHYNGCANYMVPYDVQKYTVLYIILHMPIDSVDRSIPAANVSLTHACPINLFRNPPRIFVFLVRHARFKT